MKQRDLFPCPTSREEELLKLLEWSRYMKEVEDSFQERIAKASALRGRHLKK